jgi:hypothetical protein
LSNARYARKRWSLRTARITLAVLLLLLSTGIFNHPGKAQSYVPELPEAPDATIQLNITTWDGSELEEMDVFLIDGGENGYPGEEVEEGQYVFSGLEMAEYYIMIHSQHYEFYTSIDLRTKNLVVPIVLKPYDHPQHFRFFPEYYGNNDPGVLSGTLEWEEPYSLREYVEEYLVYFVDRDGNRLTQEPLAIAPVYEPNIEFFHYDITINEAEIPQGAEFLQLYIWSDGVEIPTSARVYLWDQSSHAPAGVHMIDKDPSPDMVEYTIRWNKLPNEEEAIKYYVISYHDDYYGNEFNILYVKPTGQDVYEVTLDRKDAVLLEDYIEPLYLSWIGPDDERALYSEMIPIENNISSLQSLPGYDVELERPDWLRFNDVQPDANQIEGALMWNSSNPMGVYELYFLNPNRQVIQGLSRIYSPYYGDYNYYWIPNTSVPQGAEYIGLFSRSPYGVSTESAVWRLSTSVEGLELLADDSYLQGISFRNTQSLREGDQIHLELPDKFTFIEEPDLSNTMLFSLMDGMVPVSTEIERSGNRLIFTLDYFASPIDEFTELGISFDSIVRIPTIIGSYPIQVRTSADPVPATAWLQVAGSRPAIGPDPVPIPNGGIVEFDNGITVDLGGASVPSGAAIVVKDAANEVTWPGGMSPNGPILDFSFTSDEGNQLPGPVMITLPVSGNATAQNTGVFYYNPSSSQWEYQVTGIFNGRAYAKLEHFSIYGVFQASQAASVEANPVGMAEVGTEITLFTSEAGATIYYTLDGTTPTRNGLVYDPLNKPRVGPNGLFINAAAVKSGMIDSQIATFGYSVMQPAQLEAILFDPEDVIELQPEFNGAEKHYTATVTSDVYQIYMNPVPAVQGSYMTLYVNNVKQSVTEAVYLNPGYNTLQIEVSAQHYSPQTYWIDIYKETSPGGSPGSADIISISYGGAPLDRYYNYYELFDLPATVDQVQLDIKLADPNATVEVNGAEYVEGQLNISPLRYGHNEVELSVYGSGGETKRYYIVVYRSMDINEDELFDIADVALLIRQQYDINDDGKFDQYDIEDMLRIITYGHYIPSIPPM